MKLEHPPRARGHNEQHDDPHRHGPIRVTASFVKENGAGGGNRTLMGMNPTGFLGPCVAAKKAPESGGTRRIPSVSFLPGWAALD